MKLITVGLLELNRAIQVHKHIIAKWVCSEASASSELGKRGKPLKRFVRPTEKDGYSKKPALATKADAEDEGKQTGKEPLKFLTWNANSILLRAKNNWPEFSKFVSTVDPDIIAIQEVRVPAAGSKGSPKNQGELKDDTNSSQEEKKILMRAISSPPFGDYRVWWSLSDSKYAGTALLAKKYFHPKKISFSLDPTGFSHAQPLPPKS